MMYGERKTIATGVRKRLHCSGEISYEGSVRMIGLPSFYSTFYSLDDAKTWMWKTRMWINEMKRQGKQIIKIKGRPYVK